MRPNVLLDTGPLVALLDRRDHHHEWARVQWEDVRPPLLTCESVLSEACYLLGSVGLDSSKVMELIVRGAVAVPFRVEVDAPLIAKLMRKYSDVPMSLADACLVRMAEAVSASTVLTIDEGFRLYRIHGRQVIRSILPPAAS